MGSVSTPVDHGRTQGATPCSSAATIRAVVSAYRSAWFMLSLLVVGPERAAHAADDGRHGAISRASVNPEARADDDDVDEHWVAHELGFRDRVDVTQDQ